MDDETKQYHFDTTYVWWPFVWDATVLAACSVEGPKQMVMLWWMMGYPVKVTVAKIDGWWLKEVFTNGNILSQVSYHLSVTKNNGE